VETYRAKRVAIIIEAPMRRRLEEAFSSAGVSGYTIVTVLGGSGRSGRWSSEGQIGSSGGMLQFICIIRPERLDALLEAAFRLVEKHMGVVTVSDCEVLRAERF
jgi:nitrogen regulatory protein PII